MDRAEIKQHLEEILGYIASVRSLTRDINYGDFCKNDNTRKQVYDCLREIGQGAHRLGDNKKVLDRDIAIDTLATFKDARYDKDADLHDQNVWNLVELDLPVIAKDIQRLGLFKEKTPRQEPKRRVQTDDEVS